MQSLPKFILSLLPLLLAVASEDDDFDRWAFQRQLGAQEFVNGSHSISGAAFTPESPVVLVKAVKTIWTYIPFPPLPRLDPTPLNAILEDALRRLTDLDVRMFSKECADAQLFTYWKQLLEDNLAEVFQSQKLFEVDLQGMKRAMMVFLNHTIDDIPLENPNRYRRNIIGAVLGSVIGSELSRVFVRPLTQPLVDKFSCFVDKLVPFGSICQNDRRKAIEKLSQEVEFLEDQVFLLKTRLLEAIMVKMPADVENRKLARLGDTLEENVRMLNNTINTAIYEVTDFVEKGECAARYIQDRHRNTLIIAANFQNLTTQYRRIINDINQRRISLANMAAMMQDAMSSLVHGYLPISLIPPATLKEILNNFEFFGLNEAIPRKLIAAYYTFEVVRDAYVSDEGLHLLLEIPLSSGHGVHEVFRATPIPQPILNTERATQYQLSKTHLLMSWDKTNFSEVTEQELSTHCWGSHRLRLCKQPFSTTRSQKTTCLTGLFFNLPATVLKLCAQEVIALPQHPQALYLYDSTYLLTSAKGDFVIQNVTPSGDFKMPGCQSCLVRPTCNGRLQLPNAGLFLTPDPLSCLTESSKVVRILPTPLLRSLFDKLKEFEEVVAPELMGDIHQELLMHLKLNLAGLPDRSVTDEMLELIAQPFLQELKTVHTTLIRKVWRDVMLPCLATMLMLILAAAVAWAARKGKLYAVRRFIEGTRRDEGAAVPLADVVAPATKEEDEVSQPLTKTTPGKAAAKTTAK